MSPPNPAPPTPELDHLLMHLETVGFGYTESVKAARTELAALLAENARMRELLAQIVEAHYQPGPYMLYAPHLRAIREALTIKAPAREPKEAT